MAESALIKSIRLVVGRMRPRKAMLVRNMVAMCVAYHDRHREPPRPFKCGVGVGSPDLIGMIVDGPCKGRAIAIEVKVGKTRTTKEQIAWAAAFRKNGGFCCIVKSVEEAVRAVERAWRGESQ